MQTVTLDDVRVAHALDREVGPDGVTLRRLPAWTRPQIPDLQFAAMITMPAGVRIEFVTDATAFELEVVLTHIDVNGERSHPGVFELVVGGEVIDGVATEAGHRIGYDSNTQQADFTLGEPATIRFDGLPATDQPWEIWLPHHCAVEIRALRVSDGATIRPCHDARRRWVHYGSSISHCLEATHPTRTWPAIAARQADVDLHNLAFAGQCQLDPFVARTIRDAPADLISLKVGINLVNADSMRERTFGSALHGFIDTIRDCHPETPIAVITPIICPVAETSAGPTISTPGGRIRVPERSAELQPGALSLQRIRSIIADVVASKRAAEDTNLHVLDGLVLFGPDDIADLPDGLHPNPAGYQRMGERFHAQAFAPGAVFGS